MEIIFTNTSGVDALDAPKPASSFIPNWYKEIESYIGGEKKPIQGSNSSATIKRCMPVFDAITAGYVITTPTDVFVSQKEDENGNKFPYYEWSSLGAIQFHPVEQAYNHPSRGKHIIYPKWINPWSIKTPKGYSVLIVQPFHRESPFTIMPGIVDTDAYTNPVNFPFVLNDINFEGMIPAGTPVAQVIPFKRENWKFKLGGHKEFIESQQVGMRMFTKFFDRYKTLFRSPKEYK
jgi:hypothetical protein